MPLGSPAAVGGGPRLVKIPVISKSTRKFTSLYSQPGLQRVYAAAAAAGGEESAMTVNSSKSVGHVLDKLAEDV